MNYADNHSYMTEDWQQFMGYLDKVEQRAFWDVCPTNAIRIQALADVPDAEMRLAAEFGDEAQGIVSDTLQNSGLLLSAGAASYPLGGTAIKTLENRARISGYALSDLEKDKLARILNDCLEVTKGQALLRMHEGKIRAVHGGDKSDYVILPMPELYEAAALYLEENFNKVVFAGGYWDHWLAEASWEIQDDRLLDIYRELLLRHGQMADQELTAMIRVHTSDVGFSGANIFSILRVGEQKLPVILGGQIKLPHKDNASIELFSHNMSLVYARYQEEVEGLGRLFDTQVDYPLNVMACVMKKADIGLTLRVQAVERFKAVHGSGRCNGYDLYCGICESVFLAESNGASPRMLVDLEEKVSKCLKYRFHEFDVPGAVNF